MPTALAVYQKREDKIWNRNITAVEQKDQNIKECGCGGSGFKETCYIF